MVCASASIKVATLMDISAVPAPEDSASHLAANLAPSDVAMSNDDSSELPVFMVRNSYIKTHTQHTCLYSTSRLSDGG